METALAMKITLKQLQRSRRSHHFIVHSVGTMLYRVTVAIDAEPHLLVADNGKPLTRHSLGAMRAALQPVDVASLMLRQDSPYDEMIGHGQRQGPNTLLIPLSTDCSLYESH